MEILMESGIEAIVHGSVARGDVSPRSDVDIFIPEVVPSLVVERAILEGHLDICRRELTQATPAHTVKAIVFVDEKTKITFPLLPLRRKEREFYRFGGELGLSQLKGGTRVAGIDKRLMVIVPTGSGHYEFSAIGRAEEAAKLIRVDVEVVNERIRVLTRRDKVGRTGIYLKEELADGETFEGKFTERMSRDPSLKRLAQQRNI
jgi:hypothetical protein